MRLTNAIGIFSKLILHEKISSVKDLQAASSTSKDQAVFVRHYKEAAPLFGKIIRRIKDADLLQSSELKILLEESSKVALCMLVNINGLLRFQLQLKSLSHTHAITEHPITFSVLPTKEKKTEITALLLLEALVEALFYTAACFHKTCRS